MLLKQAFNATSRNETQSNSKFNPQELHQNAIVSHQCQPTIKRRRLLQGIGVAITSISLSQQPTHAASPTSVESIEQQYNTYSKNYDDLDGGAAADALGFPEQRKSLLQRASGDVLECGVGTGINLQFYESSNLNSFTAIDVSPGMLKNAKRKAQYALNLPQNSISFQKADISNLPFPDNSFDTVIDTFSLCVFPDPVAALKSMARVVRPGGKVLLLEHSKSKNPLLGWYQDVTAEPVAAMGKGCVWNQDVLGMLKEAGLKVERVEPHLGDLILNITAVKAQN